jgi:ketosteroid isomerase-like protein
MEPEPRQIAEEFNQCINGQNLEGLARLMHEDHLFIDREGTRNGPKPVMVKGWKEFFSMFPDYRNTFRKIVTEGNRVYILGFAYWDAENPYDPVIWSALIRDNLIAEWVVHSDTPENRSRYHLA